MRKVLIVIYFIVISSSYSLAWDGYDYDKGSYVEIESNNLVREGEEIEFYDYDSGEYRTSTVESVNNSGNSVEVEIYDYDTGEYRILDMDK